MNPPLGDRGKYGTLQDEFDPQCMASKKQQN